MAAEVERHRPGRNVGSAVPPGVHLWAPEVTGVAALSHPTSQGSETLGFAEEGEGESVWNRLVLTAGRFPG